MNKITIIGVGTMGSIFVLALKSRFSRLELVLADKEKNKLLRIKNKELRIKITTDNVEAVRKADAVILAVKPQSFAELADELKGKISAECLIVSIMAGVSIRKIQTGLTVKKVVRAMPNLGARVGKSMTVWTSAKEVGQKEKKFVQKLFSAFGTELYVKSEKMIDRATAVSGSGPGFFFYLVEEWLRAVERLGFSLSEAEKLLLTTFDAANTLLQKEKNPTELKKQVASKGGTTEAGLKVLQKADLKRLWQKVLVTAVKKAEELAK